MTPKQKAQYLHNKFNRHALDSVSDKSRSGEYHAKECVLICIDEIIDELSDLPRIPYNERRENYWKEVKKEIQKL